MRNQNERNVVRVADIGIVLASMIIVICLACMAVLISAGCDNRMSIEAQAIIEGAKLLARGW